MREVVTILYKVLVIGFYRTNAAFFVLILTLAFGFMSGTEHRALAEYFIAGPATILIPVTIWIVYVFKIVRFNITCLAQPQNNFTTHYALLPGRLQFGVALGVAALNLLPAICYGIYISIIALSHHLFISALLIFIYLTIISLGLAAITVWQLNRVTVEKQTGILIYGTRSFIRHPSLILAEATLRAQPFMVIGTILFGVILMTGVSSLYTSEAYDHRLYAMGVTIAFGSQIPLIQISHLIENTEMKILRGQPLHTFYRFAFSALGLTMLAVPHLLYTIQLFPTNVSKHLLLSVIGFAVSTLILNYSLLYRVHPERFSRLIFFVICLWLFLILSSTPLLVIIVANLGCAIWVYGISYYRFEYNITESSRSE